MSTHSLLDHRSRVRPTCAACRAPSCTQLAVELRDFVLSTCRPTGGHLSSNLGTVELTIALHYVFNTPHDRLVWDVGHQTYPHKILTGRRDRMAIAAPARRHQRLSAPRRERVRHLRHGALVDLDLGRPGHGAGGQAQGRGRQVGGHHRRRRDDRRHGLRGAEQRRRAARRRPADMLVVLNDNDMSISPAGGRAEQLPRAADVRQLLLGRARGRQERAEERPAAVRAGRRFEEHAKGMVVPGHDLRGVRLQLRRPDRRP